MLLLQLLRKTPADADVAEVIDDTAEQMQCLRSDHSINKETNRHAC
jgi:hypothetical protein